MYRRRLQRAAYIPNYAMPFDVNGYYGNPAASRLRASFGSYGGTAKRTRMFKNSTKNRSVSSVVKLRIPRPPSSSYIAMKYFDQAITGNVDATASLAGGCLAQIPGGSAESQRVGNALKIGRIEYSFQYTGGNVNASGTVPLETIRMLIVQYLSGSSVSDPGISNLLKQDPNSQYSPICFSNVDNKEDYRVLADKKIVINNYLNTAVVATHSSEVKINQGYITCNIFTKFQGTNGNQLCENPIFIYFLSNVAHTNATTDAVAVTGQVRCWYRDA